MVPDSKKPLFLQLLRWLREKKPETTPPEVEQELAEDPDKDSIPQ
jgi:hypothetical protein